MSKKEIKYINSNKKDSKAMADAKEKVFVNINWESTPTWNIISLNKTPESKADYKLFTEKGNEGNDDYDKES